MTAVTYVVIQAQFLETTVTILVAIPVLFVTRRLVARLYYLQGLLHVCSWCRKINLDGQWVMLEEFFDRGFATKTSHGMCRSCLVEMTKSPEKL
jgi:hypothetical protein